MASGVIYALIGIKSSELQVFVSTAYLCSLAITVLIVYVMVPPISNSVQGAYLTAIVLPGVMIGGGSIIFKDLTEGLGCAIGGFALSMFLLVLKPGGLLTGNANKAIFIGCFTVGIFAFSFSKYTRTYALVGSTAFAGATALVLGIDCFAQTGLKEFWLYIWGTCDAFSWGKRICLTCGAALNDSLFPLNANTYPLIKGMKAEIAGIIVAVFFGILSQIKVWRIVQAKREKRAGEQEEKQRERDVAEAEAGTRIEARNMAEIVAWEKTYDEKSSTDVGSKSTTAAASETGSLERMSFDEVEMGHLQNPTIANKAARRLTPNIIVTIAEQDERELARSCPRSPMSAVRETSSE